MNKWGCKKFTRSIRKYFKQKRYYWGQIVKPNQESQVWVKWFIIGGTMSFHDHGPNTFNISNNV
jgi:hypothetical protein